MHSRPIHVLLLDADIGQAPLVELLKKVRSGMQALLVTSHSANGQPSAISRDEALAKTRALLNLASHKS